MSTQTASSTEWRYAGFWWRVLAYYIDNLVIQAAVSTAMRATPLQQHIQTLVKAANASPQPKAKMAAIDQVRTALEKTAAVIVHDPLLVATFVGLAGVTYVGIWLYRALMESSSLQATLGKQVCRLKVVDLEGGRISFKRATARCIVRFAVGALVYVSLWAYFYSRQFSADTLFTLQFWAITAAADVPYFLAGWTPRKQALHDMIAGTLVLRRLPPPGFVPPPQLI